MRAESFAAEGASSDLRRTRSASRRGSPVLPRASAWATWSRPSASSARAMRDLNSAAEEERESASLEISPQPSNDAEARASFTLTERSERSPSREARLALSPLRRDTPSIDAARRSRVETARVRMSAAETSSAPIRPANVAVRASFASTSEAFASSKALLAASTVSC